MLMIDSSSDEPLARRGLSVEVDVPMFFGKCDDDRRLNEASLLSMSCLCASTSVVVAQASMYAGVILIASA